MVQILIFDAYQFIIYYLLVIVDSLKVNCCFVFCLSVINCIGLEAVFMLFWKFWMLH